ncbi:hypothetical protein FACS1894132_07410 [Clostridia bacterium]|nr:hypothetical protein FACS1894132_07410 [Clostridia bacterium]
MVALFANIKTIKENINGRKLIIFGTGKMSERYYRNVSEKVGPIDFFVKTKAVKDETFHGYPVYDLGIFCSGGATPDNYYIVVLTSKDTTNISSHLNSFGFQISADYCDPTLHNDVTYQGTSIGKGSFLGELEFRFIESIGRFCSLNITLYIQGNHALNRITTSGVLGVLADYIRKMEIEQPPFQKLVIGNDVWIGANVFINASKCKKIGNGAIIGAGAVVNHDVPPYAIVYGVPAKVQRYRYTPEQIEVLERVQWWNWDEKTLQKNAELLIYPNKFFERFGEIYSNKILQEA